MNSPLDFRALLLKIQDLLSDNDRHRLHFLLGEDVPRDLRDDLSLSGTLRLLDSLMEKAFISGQDCDYLIEVFNKIHCLDAARRLQEFQQTREHSNQRSFSLQNILLADNEEDKISLIRIIPNISDSAPTSLIDDTLTSNQLVSSPPMHNRIEVRTHRSRRMNLICKIPLTTREYCLLILLIIMALLASLLTIKLWSELIQCKSARYKPVPCNTNTTRVPPLRSSSIDIHPNAKWSEIGSNVAGGNGQGGGMNQLNYPWGLYMDEDQTIYIADTDNNRIVAWENGAKSGQVVAGGNGEGNGTHQLSWPYDVIVDQEKSSLIICDYRNRRVVRWPRRNGTSGEIIIFEISCVGLTMDENGFLYVVDNGKHEVRRYGVGASEGTVVAGGNGKGNHLDQLDDPRYIFVDRDHSVYVSDSNNHRVMKWMKGAKQGVIVAGGRANVTGFQLLYYPKGVVVDQFDTVYVADCNHDQIVRWPKGHTQGSVIIGGKGKGKQSHQLNFPYGLSFDRSGNLYVADEQNHRVQKFQIEQTKY